MTGYASLLQHKANVLPGSWLVFSIQASLLVSVIKPTPCLPPSPSLSLSPSSLLAFFFFLFLLLFL